MRFPLRTHRRLIGALVALATSVALVAAVRSAEPASAYAGAPWFRPSTTYLDLSRPDAQNSNFPDASIIYDGGTYYAYGATTGGAYLPVMSSTDLVHWTARPAYSGAPWGVSDPYFNDALPVAPSWGVEVPGATHPRIRKEVWAPGAAKIGSQYVVFHAVRVSNASDRFCIGASTSSSPLGPFTDSGGPLVCDVQGDPNGSIDPQPFVDANGTPYLVWKSEGVPFREPTKIWVQQLAASGTSFAPGSAPVALLATSAAWEGNVIENPSMVRWNGKYYLFYSANEWVSASYAIGYAECASIVGPCTKMSNAGPLLASRGARLGPGGPAAFVTADNRLMLGYHYWLAPHVGYPTNPNCDGNGTCTSQGQRRLAVDEVITTSGGIAVVPMSQGGACGSGASSAPVGAGTFNPLPPSRILDTRNAIGTQRFPVGQRKSISVQVRGVGGVPNDGRVSAVALNVTATDSTLGGFLSVHPTDVALPNVSNLNMVPGRTIPNLVIAKVGPDGRICIANNDGTTAVVADVVGWFDSTGASGGSFQPLTNPTRVLDTRQTIAGPAGTNEVQLQLAPPGGATGVVMNVTADAPTHSESFVTVWPSGQPRPNASSLNMVAGETAPNLVFAQLGAGNRVSFQNQFGTTHLIADVVGWIVPAAGSGGYTPVAPARILDTRSGVGAPAAKVGAGATLDFTVTGLAGVPGNATAVVVNLTVTQPSAQTFVTAYPTGEALPTASNLNVVAGQTRPNLVVARVGAGGRVSVYNFNGETHLVADVVGWFD